MEITYGEAHYTSPTPMFPVSCVAGDGEEHAGVFMTREAAEDQARKFQANYPQAARIVVYLPVPVKL